MTLPGAQDTSIDGRLQREAAPLFSVVVPTRGEPVKLSALFDALEAQTFPAAHREILVVIDGAAPDASLQPRAAALGATLLGTPRRGGPGAARNHGAAAARGEWLAFTEDDVTPASDWLERAAERIARDPGLDVIEGLTVKPGGRRVHRHAGGLPLYLPTNLFVRRDTFERAGGYCTDYFDAARSIYFREDADFGFTLEAMGARVATEPAAIVVHPAEHPGWLDPLRWARRYRMDALLESRHPERFRERIEAHRLGPFTIRRPIVRASALYVLALLLAAATAAAGLIGTAAWFVGVAALAVLVVWAKWRFDPLRLPVVLVVPFVLVWAYVGGRFGNARVRSSGMNRTRA
jgi:glycosyltransferase involved in cell wall biosynthesis